jgi:YaaC-like Protein
MHWITTDNRLSECWRYLSRYSNLDIAENRIRTLFPHATGRSDVANVKKQALQISACLFQAQEYFETSVGASLLTKPVLIYYGTVALASAVMLLRGGGEFALDRLRQSEENKSHGARFTTNSSNSSIANGDRLLRETFVEPLEKGFLSNFYRTLPENQIIFAPRTDFGLLLSKRLDRVGSEAKLEYQRICKKRSLLQLFAEIPDLRNIAVSVGAPHTAAGWHRVEYQTNSKIFKQLWGFQSESMDAHHSILSSFKIRAGDSHLLDFIESPDQKGGIVTLTAHEAFSLDLSWPEMRRDSNWRDIYYAETHSGPEFACLLQIQFGLSMLARYYPDVWTRTLDSNGTSANYIKQLLDVSTLRIPNLALNEMAGEDYFFSTLPVPWH